jgi:hypothetical protein
VKARHIVIATPDFRWLVWEQLRLTGRLVLVAVLLTALCIVLPEILRLAQDTVLWFCAAACSVLLGMVVPVALRSVWRKDERSGVANESSVRDRFEEAFVQLEAGCTLAISPVEVRGEQMGNEKQRSDHATLLLRANGLSLRTVGSSESERWIVWGAVRAIDWTLHDVQLDLMEGRMHLCFAKLPPAFGPFNHFPRLRKQLQSATFQLMSFNQHIAALCEVAQHHAAQHSRRYSTSPSPSSARVEDDQHAWDDTIESPLPSSLSSASVAPVCEAELASGAATLHSPSRQADLNDQDDTIESQTVPCAVSTPQPDTANARTLELSYPDSFFRRS